MGILEGFKNITHERNLATLFLRIRQFLPEVFCADNCGLFFISDDPSIMYTAENISKDNQGINYFSGVVKYPIGIGFTGKSITEKRPLVYFKQDDIESTDFCISTISPKEFISEIDNCVSQSNVHNGIFGPLIDGDGQIQGAIQILNMKSPLKEDEIEEFQFV
jgi:hypothetical protein